MKKVVFLVALLCACFLGSCGNSEIDKVNQLVVDATAQTKAASSPQEVMEIALTLQAEMDKITDESGNKVTFGKSVDTALEQYQEVAKAKLAEFGLEME